MTTGIIFEEIMQKLAAEKITQVKKSNAPFFIIFQLTMSIAIVYRPQENSIQIIFNAH